MRVHSCSIDVSCGGGVEWIPSQPPPHALLVAPAAGIPTIYCASHSVSARPPRRSLLNELGLQPMRPGWWSHVICSYNKAVSAAVKAATPLIAAALAADFALARRQRNLKPGTWSGCYWQSLQWKRQRQQGTSKNTVHLDGASGKPATSPIDYCHAAA